MDFERVTALRQHSAAWRLMRADSAAMVLAILGQVFVVENHRTVVELSLIHI